MLFRSALTIRIRSYEWGGDCSKMATSRRDIKSKYRYLRLRRLAVPAADASGGLRAE